MFANLFEMAAAEITRLTPNTPPAGWLPYAGYALTTAGALLVAAATLSLTKSRLASAAAAIAFVATPGPDPLGLLAGAVALLGIVTLFTAAPKDKPQWIVMPLLLGGLLFSARGGLLIWMFIGCGLWEVGNRLPPALGPKGRHLRWVGMITLVIIMIAARVPAAMTSTPPAPKPLGHDRATLTSMRALLSNIPTGAYLVRDDAATDILVRAAQRDFVRARVEIRTIKNDAANIRQLLNFGRVFALPHAQQSLAMQGFKIVDGLRVADRGLAEVVAGAECIVASHGWQDAPQLAGHTSLAFVAADDERRGPVVLMLSGREEFINVNPVGWAPRTLRGFSPRSFDLHSSEGMRDFGQAIADDNLFYNTELTSNMVTRVALWRMPDSPRQMRIELSQSATRVGIYLSPEAKEPVSVCPVFPAPVFPIR